MPTPGAANAAKTASSPPQEPVGDRKDDVPVPLVTAGIAVAGGLLVAYLTHRWATRRDRNTRFATAAAAFNAAFSEELAFLKSSAELYEGVDLLLTKAYHAKHGAAYVAFEQFVSADRRASLRKAWRHYHSGHEDYESEDAYLAPAHGAPEPGSMFSEYSLYWVGRTEDPRVLAVKRLEAVLAYARED